LAVDLTEEQSEAIRLLRTKGLRIRRLDEKSRLKLREAISSLHLEGGVSLSDIAKLVGNKTSGYTSWLCRELGVPARPFEEARLKGIREKRRKYERRPFDGDEVSMGYMLGLCHGDLHAYVPFRGAVRASTSTTHPAMADLFTQLFGRFGHVYRFPRFKNDTRTYEWNLEVVLDDSFGFLLWTVNEAWRWVADNKRVLGYIAGFLDAEGHIGISDAKGRVALIISFHNTDTDLLERIRFSLGGMGFTPLGPYLEKERGTVSPRYGIVRKKDYWRIALARFDECRTLLRDLPIRHSEKVARKELALGLGRDSRWGDVGPVMRRLRLQTIKSRDSFVDYAKDLVEAKKTQRPSS
jgi:hypothetical protein